MFWHTCRPNMDDTQRRKPNEQKMSTLKRHLGRFSIWDNQVVVVHCCSCSKHFMFVTRFWCLGISNVYFWWQHWPKFQMLPSAYLPIRLLIFWAFTKIMQSFFFLFFNVAYPNLQGSRNDKKNEYRGYHYGFIYG